MKKIDLISMSIRNLLRRKFRTVLTVLGVVIGSSSIILMLSLGLAMNKNLEEQMAQMGDLTQIEVYNYGNAKTIDNKVIKELAKMQNVEHVVPMINPSNFTFSCGKFRTFNTYWSVYVMKPEDMEALGYEINQGRSLMEGESRSIILGEGALRYFTKNGKQPNYNKGFEDMEALGYEINQGRSLMEGESRSIILGEGALRYFTKNGKQPNYNKGLEPMAFDMDTQKMTIEVLQYDWQTGKPNLDGKDGKIKKPKSFEVEVVGTIADGTQQGMQIIIPPALYEELKAESIKYRKALGWYRDEEKDKDKKVNSEQVIVKVNDRKNVMSVAEALKKEGYEAYTNMEWIEQMEEQSKSRQMALGAIGIVSFVVAAIGIANTMMMSIYERTKEIGVMKVIGAKLKDIKYMFLMESLLIGFFGGLLGATISLIISIIMNASSDKIAQIMDMYGATTVSIMTPQLFGGGILFSVVVGLLSGYFPAQKAMKLSALSAIRTE